MRLLFTTTLALCTATLLFSQKLIPPSPAAGESLPEWAQLMYGPNPNVWAVDDAYRIWRQTHPDDKTTYTQYYKKWRRAAEPFIHTDGFVRKPTDAETSAFRQRLATLRPATDRNQGEWTCIGPFETFNTNTGPDPLAKSEQANIYCFDQSLSNPDVVYCGTEGSEIFKSTDRGQNWFCVSRALDITAVTALEVHPTNPDIVFAGEGSRIRRTLDGGHTWEIVLDVPDFSPNEILVNPADPQIVLAATWKGLFRSTDGGSTWIQVFTQACYDVEWKADDPATGFLVCNNPQDKICQFFKSSDSGATWVLKDNGWFASSDPGRNDGGARLAVTKADPNRVYAVLIGEAKTDDSGFIGIFRSDDAGESWSLPNPPAGGPYLETSHPNMATIGATGGYHQGFYNLGFDASDTNADELLAGFLNLWVSHDGATSFSCIGGYCGNSFNYVHPDCQEIEINDGDVWMTSDGGIEYSTDFFETHHARNRGITSSDFWGFGAGWNDDVLVGGRYHNGNAGWYEDWLPGETLGLGGGEAPTGYVNPGEARKTYYSDIGGVILPEQQNGYAQYFSIGKYPNESYYDAESGEIEWDPRCWNTFYVTNANKLWRTDDGGSNWTLVHSFGLDANARTMSFEISRSNPEVMYLFQRAAYSWDPGKLWKTTNGGQTWTALSFPPGYARRVLLTMSPSDENLLWLAYADGGNGEKIYRSADGGQTWTNLTTAALNDEHISYILHQGGTAGGVYLGTFRTIWYKNDNMAEWVPYDNGLPYNIATCILRPFYRDGKLRLGAYGKGIWEAPLYEPSLPVAQPMVEKRVSDCPNDIFQFDDYSMLAHAGATWHWEFPGGQPSNSDLRNPQVVYHIEGSYDVTLTVTTPAGTSTKTVPAMIQVLPTVSNPYSVSNDFSGGLGNFTIANPDGDITWAPISFDNCDPAGDTCMYVNNYVYSGYGVDDIVLPLNLDLRESATSKLTFRVAYAPYFDGNAFIDSLKVLVSDDCGSTFDILFNSGGEALSTTTSGLGANNLYEYESFAPASCAEWREVELDLSAYLGKYITIKFRNQSGYGNNMYLDDIKLDGLLLVGASEPEKFGALPVLQPNPTTAGTVLRGTAEMPDELVVSLEQADGRVVSTRTLRVPAGAWAQPLPTEHLPAGVYWVRVSRKGGSVLLKLVKQ